MLKKKFIICPTYRYTTLHILFFNHKVQINSFDFNYVIQSVCTVVVIHHCLLTFGRYFTSPAHHFRGVDFPSPMLSKGLFVHGTDPTYQNCLTTCHRATD